MNILVAWVGYKGVDEHNAMSILDLSHVLRSHHPTSQLALIHNDAMIDRSRSRILSSCIHGRHDCVIMIDHDLEFSPQHVIGLCARAVEQQAVIGVPFACRGTPIKASGRTLDGSTPTVGIDTLVPTLYTGTFLAVPREALEQIVDRCRAPQSDPFITITQCTDSADRARDGYPRFWDFCRPGPVRQSDGRYEYLSEEWSFCHRAHFASVPVLNWLQPSLNHYGNHPFSLPSASSAASA
jgi:hypothetical protein